MQKFIVSIFLAMNATILDTRGMFDIKFDLNW